MNDNERRVVQNLITKAREYELAACDEVSADCPSDPCPFCTAGTELQTAYLDAEDLLEQTEGTT